MGNAFQTGLFTQVSVLLTLWCSLLAFPCGREGTPRYWNVGSRSCQSVSRW